MNQGKFNLFEFLTTIVKRRKIIYINVISVSVISLIISLLLPKWFRAEAIILPPMSESFSFGLGGAIGELAGSILGPSGYELPMLATRADVYETIVKSQRVAEDVINHFDLIKIYKCENMDYAIRELNNHIKTEVNRDGSLKISFEAKKNPQMAADIANYYIATLDRINQETSQSKAKNTRMFIEKRLVESKDTLSRSEMALKHFQEENNTLSLPEQTKATVEGAAQLIGEITALRIQLGVMNTEMSPSHASVREIKNRITQMEKFLMEMKKGVTTKSSGSDGIEELLIPLQKVPELGLKYARLYREVKIQEIVFELLTQQYEQAKIREMEDTPTLQILQKATPPFLKCRPKKLVIILISVIFAVMVSFVIVLTQEFLERMKNQRKGDYEKIAWIFDQIKQDLKALNFKK